MTPATPLPDDTATIRSCGRCAGCGQTFIPTGRALHCSAACRKRVFRACHGAPATVDLAGAPPQASRREHTVSQCPDCGDRQLGVQRCQGCGRFGRAVGLGGACPGCGEPVTVGGLALQLRVPR